MIRYILLLLLLPALAQSQQNTLNDAFASLHLLMESPDSGKLASLAHPNLVYVHSSNTVRDKNGFVKEFIAGQTKIKNISIHDKNIIYTGHHLATIRYHLMADNSKDNPPSKMDIIVMQVWIKEKKKWYLLARQAAKIPAEYVKAKL